MSTMTTEESALRRELARRVKLARRALRRIKEPDTIDAVGTDEAAAALAEANRTLAAAKATVSELEQVEALSDEALMLVANARLALAMVHEMIGVLCADLDSRLAA